MSTATYIGILLFDRTPFNSSLTTAKRLKKKKQQQQPKTKNLADLWKRKKKKRKNCYHKLSSRRSKLSIFNIVLSKECDHLPRVISL